MKDKQSMTDGKTERRMDGQIDKEKKVCSDGQTQKDRITNININ